MYVKSSSCRLVCVFYDGHPYRLYARDSVHGCACLEPRTCPCWHVRQTLVLSAGCPVRVWDNNWKNHTARLKQKSASRAMHTVCLQKFLLGNALYYYPWCFLGHATKREHKAECGRANKRVGVCVHVLLGLPKNCSTNECRAYENKIPTIYNSLW